MQIHGLFRIRNAFIMPFQGILRRFAAHAMTTTATRLKQSEPSSPANRYVRPPQVMGQK
jgi:hypothetical protein